MENFNESIAPVLTDFVWLVLIALVVVIVATIIYIVARLFIPAVFGAIREEPIGFLLLAFSVGSFVGSIYFLFSGEWNTAVLCGSIFLLTLVVGFLIEFYRNL